MLEIKDLAVQYGNQAPTIEHFNLSMKKGEIISVVGESGSGKTTVIRAVLGALSGAGRVTSGDILYHGESLLKNSKSDWRKIRGSKMSMIFQDLVYFRKSNLFIKVHKTLAGGYNIKCLLWKVNSLGGGNDIVDIESRGF